MNGKLVVVLLSGMLFACAPPAPSAPAPATTPPASPAAAAPSLGPNVVTIRTVSCDALLRSSEDDRASASLFYLGYTAARRGQRKIDIAEVEGLEAAALGNCEANPDQPAASAFMKAFSDNGR